ncbi:hypothetical protein COLO4_16070 [Corchorus olitorius]|uniref:Uncharacterized protein n=1 Tax=Corchorus olitorius TaxID=93759 RepID=A0A1R3JJS9_9ROSI|nr:hypothetical protein COLO4_16070 [Corchorus olitorius]
MLLVTVRRCNRRPHRPPAPHKSHLDIPFSV